MTTAGQLTGSGVSENVLVYASNGAVSWPAAACGGGKLLVVWSEQDAAGTRIMGQALAP